ncbi:MAG: tRNA(Glu)-specific nuclease WapA precursor [Verrucomicrobiota bacterium]
MPRAILKAVRASMLAIALAALGAPAHGAGLTFAGGRASGAAGAQVTVPVLVTNFSGVSLFQFSVHWNPAVAGYVGVEQFGLPGMGSANFGTAQAAAGTLTVSWDDPNGLSSTVANGTAIFHVRLQLLGTPGTSMPLTLDGTPTPIEAADATFSTIPVSVVGGLVTINAADQAPQITAQPQSISVVQGGAATFSVTATGTAPLTYQWRFNGLSMGNETSSTLGLVGVQPAQAGGYSVVVANSVGAVTSTVATLTVTASNVAPVIGAIGTLTVAEGGLLSYAIPASDVDQPAQALTYALVGDYPVGLALNPTNGLMTWAPLESQGPGTNQVSVRVTDNGVPALSDTRSFSIVVQEVNSAPVIGAVANRVLNEGSVLTFFVSATDADLPANRLAYSLDPGAPQAASIHPQTGEFTWVPGEDKGPSLVTITVRVTDNGNPALSDSTTFTLTVNEVNTAPVLPAPGNRVVAEGTTLAFEAGATDGDLPAQALFYTLDAGAPAGASIHPGTGSFAWTPSEAQGPSTNLITIRVTDNGSPMLSDSKSFLVVVTEVNAAPVLVRPSDGMVVEGATVVVTNLAADSDIPVQPLVFSLAPGAPAGASIHPVSGLVTWSTGEPHGPSTNRFTVVVAENAPGGLSATQSFVVVVLESNLPPVLQSVADQAAQVLVPLVITNRVSDPDSPTNRLSFQFLQAPKGARLNRLTGVVYWSPARDQAGSTNLFSVVVMDDGEPMLQATNTFRVTVDDFVELGLGAAVLRSGDAGSVPLHMLSSVGVTNIQSRLLVPAGRLAGLSLLGTAPELGSAGLQSLGAGESLLSLETLPGQALAASQQLGHLNFTAVATQSTFVPLTLATLQARQTNGALVGRTLTEAGRVVVIAEEPLLEAKLETNRQRQLVLYGPPGVGYRIEQSPGLDPADWQSAWQGSLTNLYQVIPLPGTNGLFYRATRLP